jgi:dimethylamine--corrinoid protein Co-methyltransferase
MPDKILTRMGDGERVTIPAEEVKEELLLGTRDAAQKGQIPELTQEDLDQMFEILAESGRIVSVPPGDEVIVTDDGCGKVFCSSSADGGAGLPISRQNSILAYERGMAADTASLGHEDYSFKPVKPIIDYEAQTYYSICQAATVPFFYGAQPNLGLYFRKDGPHPNPADLLPVGKIDEARSAQEEAAEQLREDMVYVGRRLAEIGCEGLNFDTAGSAGDADFYATLVSVAELKEKFPLMAIELGMSNEFVLGMHGDIRFEGKLLAGMYPHEQAQVSADAGADIFGPAINVNTSRSFAWNLARAVTFVKHTSEVSDIPVHPNVGMGVGGVPMCVETPIDCVTRSSKALVMIGKADGL